MQSNCDVVGFSRDLTTNKIIITLKLYNASLAEIEQLQKRDDLEVTLCKAKRKRSLDANAYFHVLNGLLADKLSISKPRCKNILLGRYGQRETGADGKPLILSVLSEIDLLERDDIHTIPVGYGYTSGKQFTHYAVVKPSHLYTTDEMATLIKGTVEEAEAQGINTMTPEQIQRLAELWGAKK